MRFSSNVASLEPSATLALAARARALREEGHTVVDLSAGEPSFGTPEFAAEAGIRAIRDGHTGYPPTPGIPELREAVARYSRETTAADAVEPEDVLVSAGVKQALFNCIFALFGPGDEVLVPAPYWTSYLPQIRLAGARPVVVTTGWDDRYRVDPDLLDAHRSEGTRGLILNSPSNPTGEIYPLPLLRDLADWARRHDLWLLSDEIYRRLHFGEGPAPSLLDVEDRSARSVVFDGVSKSFSMTGWRIGWAVGPRELIRKAADLQSQTTSGAVNPSQHAAAAAVGRADAREAAVAEYMTRLVEARRRGLDALADVPGFDLRPPDGGMFFWLRLRDGGDSLDVAERLLLEAGVAAVPGEAFGAPGHLRLNFAVTPEALREGTERLSTFFREAERSG